MDHGIRVPLGCAAMPQTADCCHHLNSQPRKDLLVPYLQKAQETDTFVCTGELSGSNEPR